MDRGRDIVATIGGIAIGTSTIAAVEPLANGRRADGSPFSAATADRTLAAMAGNRATGDRPTGRTAR